MPDLPEPTVGRRTVRVTFVLPASAGARSASIAGDFNAWSIDANPMERDVRGGFTVTLDLSVGRHYEYRFWIDDAEWENDWYADSYVPNEYGGNNSCIDLTEGSPRARLHAPTDVRTHSSPDASVGPDPGTS